MSCTDPQVPPEPLTITRGASKTFTLVARDDDKQPMDLTGAKVWFTVKNRIEDIAAVISKKNLTAGGTDVQILITPTQTGATKGQYKVMLAPPDTAGLDPEMVYWCDAWVETTAGARYQVMQNTTFKIDPAVTTVFI